MSLQKLSTAEVREKLAQVVNEAAFGNKTTIIERYGRGVAAIVPISFVAEKLNVHADALQSWPASSTEFVSFAVTAPIHNEEEEQTQRETCEKPEGGPIPQRKKNPEAVASGR